MIQHANKSLIQSVQHFAHYYVPNEAPNRLNVALIDGVTSWYARSSKDDAFYTTDQSKLNVRRSIAVVIAIFSESDEAALEWGSIASKQWCIHRSTKWWDELRHSSYTSSVFASLRTTQFVPSPACCLLHTGRAQCEFPWQTLCVYLPSCWMRSCN